MDAIIWIIAMLLTILQYEGMMTMSMLYQVLWLLIIVFIIIVLYALYKKIKNL